VILLPKEKLGLADLEKQLTEVSISTIPSRLKSTTVLNLQIPEFKVETFIPLTNKSPILQQVCLFYNKLTNYSNILPKAMYTHTYVLNSVVKPDYCSWASTKPSRFNCNSSIRFPHIPASMWTK
jgi:serine protease inhibitor